MNRDHGCDSGDQRDPWMILLDQCERIVLIHEHLRMDTDEDEATRLRLVETTRTALGQAREHVASLASWLDEQIAEADRNGWASDDPGAPRVRENNAVARFAREVRARLGGDDEERGEG